MAEGKEGLRENSQERDNDNEDRKIERILRVAHYYYQRKDIKKALLDESKDREIVPRYYNNFGKRPDMLQYENDLRGWVDKGATSFHCSEERWSNPLEISESNMNELRTGWDLILDIDCPFIEYSKTAAQVLVEALQLHGINNFGIKFSGGSGFHIGIAFEAFPKKVNDIEIKNFFPSGPRTIAAYLKELIQAHLADHILEINTMKEISERTGKKFERKFDPFAVVGIDTVLISPRHLFRMPYSLHERTCLASIVIKKEQLKNFHPGWASPSRVFPKFFLPKPEKDEAKNLIIQALDWESKKIQAPSEKFQKTGRETILKDVSSDFYPPCVKFALAGMKQDGRKRALFILINFLKSLNLSAEEIGIIISEWDKKNYKPLKEGYIKAQIQWHKKQKPMLPPNCDKPYYKDIGICNPDPLCGRIKNPVNYVRLKMNFSRNLGKNAAKKPRARKEEPEFKPMRHYSG